MADDVLRPVDDTARALARRLLRTAFRGALASLEPQTGWPYGSLVTVATTLEGRPLLLVSSLSLHTRALAADPRCSLLLDAPGAGDPLAHPRLTIFGRAEFLDRNEDDGRQARRRFLGRHPKAALYADFGDFSFVRIDPERALLNAGFGRASELGAADFLTRLDAALLPLRDVEADAIAHMNRDHSDAVRQIATALCGASDGEWQVTGLDPEGLDMALGESRLRYVYPEPLADATQLRAKLVEATRQARGREAGIDL
jgi:putative heme iron utilization protein